MLHLCGCTEMYRRLSDGSITSKMFSDHPNGNQQTSSRYETLSIHMEGFSEWSGSLLGWFESDCKK